MKKPLKIILVVCGICLAAAITQWAIVHFGLQTLFNILIPVGLFLGLVVPLYYSFKAKQNKNKTEHE